MRRLALIALLLAGCRSTEPAPVPQQFQVIALAHANANELAAEIRAIIPSRASGGTDAQPASVVADARTNSLLVRADASEMATIRELVTQLDRRVEAPAQ